MQQILKSLTRKTRAGRRGSASLDPDVLALNLSYVLHEHSDSSTVASHAVAAMEHARLMSTLPAHELLAMPMVGLDELAERKPGTILTATLGIPLVLSHLAMKLETQPQILTVDRDARTTNDVAFFRGKAQLVLPATPLERPVVAAAILRPGGRSIQLLSAGPFNWPGERETALMELENIIRDHCPQWHPSRALWEHPAELALPEMLGE